MYFMLCNCQMRHGITTSHVHANLSFMETKLRMITPLEERHKVHTLSAQHILDSFPNGLLGFRTQRQFNEAVDEFLLKNGVAREADYGSFGPDTRVDHERYKAFVNRVHLNPPPLVRIVGETVERLTRDPAEDNPHFSFEDELRKKIVVSPLLLEMKPRKGFRSLAPGEILGTEIEFEGSIHSTLCTGYKTTPDRECFQIMNSFGRDWCDDGFGDILSDDINFAWHYEVEVV